MTNALSFINKIGKAGAAVLFLPFFLLPYTADAQSDTVIRHKIDQVTVLGKRVDANMRVMRDGLMRLPVAYISSLPKIMGNADPVRYIQMLPGVQVNSEYDSGIHIQGCDNTHNYMAVSGAPVYNAGHLLGFFSVFNPEHFSEIEIVKTPRKSSFPNRLGGEINMNPRKTVADSLSVTAELGLISSQGAVTIPIGSGQTLMLAARGSYLNLLYSQWLKIDETALKYSFSDFNIRHIFRSDSRRRVYFDLYHGSDHLKTDGTLNLGIRWGNDMAALHYDVVKPLRVNSIVYFSRYNNKIDFSFTEATANMSSDISTFGAKTEICFGYFSIGLDAAYHNILPQNPQSEYNNILLENTTCRINVAEAYSFCDYEKYIFENTKFVVGARLGVYTDYDGMLHFTADPNASVSQGFGNTEVTVAYAARHQNIFQTGCSTVSLPTDFWYAASDVHKPQGSHGFLLGVQSLFGSRFSVNAEAYYKIMQNQTEYYGTLLDLVNSNYDINDYLIASHGYNYGLSVMLNKRTGIFKGWIGYSYGRAWRKSEIQEPRFPATHERPHELDVVATFYPFKRVDFGATFVYASGTPFTSPDYFYLLNGNLMMQYGDHNANRLKPYIRLDVSANITLHRRKNFSDGINVSVYNLLGRANDIFYSLKYYNGEFKYSHITFAVKTLPNISYYLKF